MFIITAKEIPLIIGVGEKLKYLENGYPCLINENISFPTDMVNVYEVAELPQKVEAEKYCYTEADGFYIDPNWEEPNPYGIPNDIYNSIIDDYTDELIEMGVL